MDPLKILLIAAAVIYLIVRRFAGQPLQARSLTVPLALTVWGVLELRGAALTAVDIAFLAVSLLVGVGAGAARGATTRIYERDGHLWQRYTLLTLGVWILLIMIRIGLSVAGHSLGAHLATGQATLLTVGVSLIAESLVTGYRARLTGVPMATSRRETRRQRAGAGYR